VSDQGVRPAEIRRALGRSHLNLRLSGSGLGRAGRDDHHRDPAERWLADRRLHQHDGRTVGVHLIPASGLAVSRSMPRKL